jgi:hypothetical protein
MYSNVSSSAKRFISTELFMGDVKNMFTSLFEDFPARESRRSSTCTKPLLALAIGAGLIRLVAVSARNPVSRKY